MNPRYLIGGDKPYRERVGVVAVKQGKRRVMDSTHRLQCAPVAFSPESASCQNRVVGYFRFMLDNTQQFGILST